MRASWLLQAQWQQEVEAQKRSRMGTLIVVERGGLPLVCHGEVQLAVAIHIGRRDTPTHLRYVEAQLRRQVIVAAAFGSHKEGIVLMAAQVITRLETGPTSGIA
jgi:hypothetical protein